MPDEARTVVISSTAHDLPDYRKEVMDACLRMGLFPKMMEHLPALDADAIQTSLDLVDQAEVYLGVFAHRYGYVPKENNPRQISITEMEYDRATERGVPRLIFLMDDNQPVKPADVDKGASAEKLEAFKRRLSIEQVRDTFTNKEDLRGKVIHALSVLKERQQVADKSPPSFHPPNIIPKPPEPYIAHPYSLLQTKDVVGRQAELNLLTDWVTTNQQVPADTRIFNLVAIGGMGKSALTWKWFNDIAPNDLPNLAGRLWWSFYESDAHWENFIIRALTYVSGQSEKAVREMTSPDREDQLWRILDQQPFLLVLDGLERTLVAYARMDAAQMLDDDLDEQAANRVGQAHGLPENAGESFIGKHQLRRTAEHRVGQFLRRLARVKQSSILITTRLYPAELQMDTGDTLPGCFASFLTGLKDDDALNLWREFKVTGSREQLLSIFNSVQNYPLLIRALAGEVAAFRPAPGEFDKWKQAHPQFNPAALPLKNANTHVLEYALGGLSGTPRKVLHTLAAFRMPALWDTLRALLVCERRRYDESQDSFFTGKPTEALTPQIAHHDEELGEKPCSDDQTLDAMLTELEDRGLLGWDRKANRYDLHPIVRAVVWRALHERAQTGIYIELQTYFEAVPKIKEDRVKSLDDLTAGIELYCTLIGLERFDDAFAVYSANLEDGLLYRLNNSHMRAELLERLLPDGMTPQLSRSKDRNDTLSRLALAYHFRGEIGRAAPLLARAARNYESEDDLVNASVVLGSASYGQRIAGRLFDAGRTASRALSLSRSKLSDEGHLYAQGMAEHWRALLLAVIGRLPSWQIALQRAASIWLKRDRPGSTSVLYYYRAQCLLWSHGFLEALRAAEKSVKLALIERRVRDIIRALRVCGTARLATDSTTTAQEQLEDALNRSREVGLVEEELPALSALAEWHRQRKNLAAARELLEQVWESAERGPYPLFHADALNVLAQIERDQGNREAAIAVATKAYTLAWCDGPPYAYHYGLTNARQHLQELGAPEPQLPPFDEAKFEPMHDVELNPKDEFWVDPDNFAQIE